MNRLIELATDLWTRARARDGLALRCMLLTLFAANALFAALRNSGVCDEIAAHIPAGYLYWFSGEFSGGVNNPPLGQLLIALPWRLLGFEYELFSEQNLMWFRVPVLLMAVGLGQLIFTLGRRFGGRDLGLAALGLFAFSPNLLAHGSIGTLDLPVAFWVVLTIWLLDRCLENPRLGRFVWLGLALGGAVMVKATALALVPLILLVLSVNARSLTRRLVVPPFGLGLAVVLVGLAASVVIDLCYLHLPVRDGGLLPPEFLTATRAKFAHVSGGHFGYLLGEYSTEGWWYFFPVAILLKTPLPVLILLAVGLWRRPDQRTLLLVYLPVLAFLAPAMIGRINIGLRHVLVIYPFLHLIGGRGAVRLAELKWGRPLLVLLIAGYLAQAALVTPHHLSYFNLAGGGPTGGHRHLIDSNYDWGQNDWYLRRHIAATGLEYVIDPDPTTPIEGNILVNVNALYGVLGAGERAYWWLKDREPDAQVAHTWFDFRIPPGSFGGTARPSPVPETLVSEAVRARQLAADVDSPNLHLRLASLLTSVRAYDLAFAELRDLLARHPGHRRALHLGGELRVRWKLGVLDFVADQYLRGFHTTTAAAGPDPDPRALVSAANAGKGAQFGALFVDLGLGQYSAGNQDAAIESFQRALSFDPGNKAARHNLGALGVPSAD